MFPTALDCRNFILLKTRTYILWNTYLTNKEKTLAHVLKDQGYVTGLVGKWHLGESDFETFEDYGRLTDPGVVEKIRRNYEINRQYVKEQSAFDYVESLFPNNELAIAMPKDAPCHHNMP